MADERRIVRFTGSVQGVGFRFTACRVAARYAVTGTVRNCGDGSVECVVEGGKKEIDAFVAELAETMAGYIRSHTSETCPQTGEFSTFTVAF
jgi:acylphosphatase